MSEMLAYYHLADPKQTAGLHNLYDDPLRNQMAIAETTYILMHNELPAWGTVVERFEIDAEGYVFVHRDMPH